MKPIPKKHDTVSVFGLGRSGRALIAHLCAVGAHVYAFDDAPEEALGDIPAWLSSLGVPLYAGGTGEARGEFVFRTPAMRPDAPALCRAALRGAVVLGEAEYFAALCPCPIYAVTGSDGKTTTATMLAHLLSASGKRVYLGGNIGRSLLPFLGEMRADDVCVLELSSFQVCDMECRFAVGAVTNLSPNHLNWHTSFSEYEGAKRRLAVLSERRVLRAGLFDELSGTRFSASEEADFCLRNGMLFGFGVPLCAASDVRLPGRHNIENLLCAAAAAADAVTPAAVRELARRFGGVAHRAEWVGRRRGVDFINSSIDTTPTRTAATLRALAERSGRILLLLGGRGKGVSNEPLLPALLGGRVRPYLFGEAAEEMGAFLSAHAVSYAFSPTMGEALRAAYADAREGDTVLLSPAATSFDAFVDYEARGDFFRRAVESLPT